MTFLSRLEFGNSRLPAIFQIEAAECGLACLAMIASYHGHRVDLPALRARFSISLHGVSMPQLMQFADGLKMASRPVRLELEELSELRLPCILHWNLNHFVVLKEVDGKGIVIHDPALGLRRLAFAEVSKSFTGVALELTPNADFKSTDEVRRVSLLGLMGKVDGLWRAFGLVFGMALALEVFALISPMFNQWVVDEALISGDAGLLNVLVVGFALLLVIQTAITLARGWTVMYLATHLNLQWAANVFTHLLRLPLVWFEKRHLGDVVSRFGSISTIQQTLTTGFIEAMLDGLMATATLAMLFVYSLKLTLVVLAAVALYGLLRALSYRPLREANEENLVLAANAQSCFLETIRGVQAIKLFGRELERRSRWLNLAVDAINRTVRTQKFMLWFGIANTCVFGLENLLVFWLGANMVMDGSFTIGMLFAFSAYQAQFTGRISSLINKYIDFRMLSLHAERLADIVLEAPEQDVAHAQNTEQLLARIELVDVGFRYSDVDPWVLRHVHLAIEPGESLALVGPSGCGKTTLVKLILGLLEPVEGEIRYGGVAIQKIGHRAYRQMMAVVMQDDNLMSGSLADNISFFDPQVDHERIEASAKLAAVHDDIVAMAMGYHTLSGDMGTSLSGGQKQRVLLARALYRSPKVLVLDEATSHLDVERERLVNQSVGALDITRICVAHRPETIAMAERVVRLHNGVIVEDVLQVVPRLAAEQTVQLAPAAAEPLAACLAPLALRPFEADLDDDFAALDASIGEARIVLLGQQSYGEGNTYALKARMVRYLHERKGFTVLALESGSFDVECVGEAVDAGQRHEQAARGAIFRLLAHAREARPLFAYLDAQRLRPDGLRMLGFDTMLSGCYSLDRLCERLRQQLASSAPGLFLDDDWQQFGAVMHGLISMRVAPLESAARQRFEARLEALRQALHAQPDTAGPLLESPSYWRQLLCFAGRELNARWAADPANPADDQAALLRQQNMGEYLLWLAEQRCPKQKIIVWTSNANALRAASPAMGAQLAGKLGGQMCSIGFTAGGGSFLTLGSDEPVSVAPPLAASLEARIAAQGLAYSVLDVRRADRAGALAGLRSWRFSEYQAVDLPLAQAFDVMIHAQSNTASVQMPAQ